jgi:hypothetical protein
MKPVFPQTPTARIPLSDHPNMDLLRHEARIQIAHCKASYASVFAPWDRPVSIPVEPTRTPRKLF